MSKWSNRMSKVLAALAGGFRYLPVAGLPGTRIRIPLQAHRGFYSGPMPDADLVEFLASALPGKGSIFFDIGANIGTYSAAIGVAKRGDLRGAAFEPVPSTQELLRSTFDLNGLRDLRVEPVALSSQAGEVRFTAYGGGGNNFMVQPGDARGQVVARCMTLDDWMAAHPDLPPHAIKIDVEGHELEVLKGARGVLQRCRPALVVECHCASWPALGVDGSEVQRLLSECGYDRLVDRKGALVDLTTCTRTVHVLCRSGAAA